MELNEEEIKIIRDYQETIGELFKLMPDGANVNYVGKIESNA